MDTCLKCWLALTATMDTMQRAFASVPARGQVVSFHPCMRCGTRRQAHGLLICADCWEATEGREAIDVAKLEADWRWLRAINPDALVPGGVPPAMARRLDLIWQRLTADSCTVTDPQRYPDWRPARLHEEAWQMLEQILAAARYEAKWRDANVDESYWKHEA